MNQLIELPTNLKDTYDHLIVHAVATPPSLDGDAAWVDRVHRAKGWTGNGYNAIIMRDGTLQHHPSGHRCRPYGKPGAHVGGCGPGWNERSIGISMFGGVKEDGVTPEDNFTDAQLDTLYRYVAKAIVAFAIPTDNVMGHRDLIKMTNSSPKACPCFSVRSWLNDLIGDYGGRRRFPTLSQLKGQAPAKTLKVPKVYTVQAGDTLWSISNTYGVSLAELYARNEDVEPTGLRIGQELRLLGY